MSFRLPLLRPARRTAALVAGGLSLAGAAWMLPPQGNEIQVNTSTGFNEVNPVIAANDAGAFVVAWVGSFEGDIYAQRFDATGARAGGELRVNTVTAGSQFAPAVAIDDAGNFIVAWTSEGQDGNGRGVFARRYEADGEAVEAEEFVVNTTTDFAQESPSVAMSPTGAFVVAWSGYVNDGESDMDVYLQRFDALGDEVGGETHVNTFTPGDQSEPDVAMDDAGNFAVVWYSEEQDGDGYGVYLRRYEADGDAIDGAGVPVNTATEGDQTLPAVAMDADGDFVVAWQGLDAAGNGIFARRYDDGVPGAEVPVNTTTAGNQQEPAVAMKPDGAFVVAWHGPDANGPGIYARRYDATGAEVGDEFAVNTTTTNSQRNPAAAIDAAGVFTIAWESAGNQDGTGYGIFAQRFAADGSQLPVELTSFDARVDGDAVLLRWHTASETNNAGFHVELRHTTCEGRGAANGSPCPSASPWNAVAFVAGHGTTAAPRDYQHRVGGLAPGRYAFRLRQVDHDGAFAYSPEAEATVETPGAYVLSALYPNPFNPRGTFTLAVGEGQPVVVEVVDALGRRVAVLHDAPMEAHRLYPFTLDGHLWPSGTYLVRATGRAFTAVRAVILAK